MKIPPSSLTRALRSVRLGVCQIRDLMQQHDMPASEFHPIWSIALSMFNIDDGNVIRMLLSRKSSNDYEIPRSRADSRVTRCRIIQAAERARHAIAQHAIGCDVMSGVTPASSASQAVSVIANSMMVLMKPARWGAVRP